MAYWFAVVAALLVVSGYGKISNPAPTAGALDTAGLPSGTGCVIWLGVAEVVAGLAGLLLPAVMGAVPVGLIYAGFTVFVVVALVRRWPIQSCGCFARIDTPPSWLHVVFDLTAVATAVSQFAERAPGTVGTIADLGWWGVAFAVAVPVGVAVAYHLVFALPTRLHRRSPQNVA